MTDRPDAGDLLAEARRALREEIAPQLDREARCKVLMIANAIGIAEREIACQDRVSEAERRLQALQASAGHTLHSAIRGGLLDGDREFFGELVELTRARLRISNPKVLNDQDGVFDRPPDDTQP